MQLSEQLDPEDLRDVLAAYQQACASVIRRFEGHIARYFGDGILVYFGFPTAHEDEPQRAVRSGLGIVEGVTQLNQRLTHERGIQLRVRVGIHTGLVVAGDIAPGADLESMAAVGETPNIAARLQALAAPDTVVISAASFQLIAGYFNTRELGFQTLRGIANPMAIYEVLHESGARTRVDVAALRGLRPMVGRDSEFEGLAQQWDEASTGHGRVTLVVGEPGIGKSRLAWAVEEHVAQNPQASLVKLTCSPYHTNTAFHPLVEFVEQTLLRFEVSDTIEQRLHKIDGFLTQYGFKPSEVGPLMASLLSIPFESRYPPLDLPAERRRQLTIDAVVRTVSVRAARQPLLFVVEDLHWADASTLGVLHRLIELLPGLRVLLLFTCRPEFATAWPDAALIERVFLNRLDQDASIAIINDVAGRPVSSAVSKQLSDKADGVPLYLEELTRLMLESGDPQDSNLHDDRRQISQPSIPATLTDLLMARIDRLGPARIIAQIGATIGRRFTYDLLESVLRMDGPVDPGALRQDLDHLVSSGLVLEDEGVRPLTYTFKHALVQDVAYDSLLRATRQHYHQRVAQVLTERYPKTVETAPEVLAHHYSRAGMLAEALPYWLRAGEHALRASANAEAIAQLSTGLDELSHLPADSDRDALELGFLLTIGPAYMATRGYAAPEVETGYDRARELCRALGDKPPLAPVLYGLWTYYIVRAQHARAGALAEAILELGRVADDQALQIQGNMALGWSHFFRGRPMQARYHLERTLELYNHELHASHTYTFGDNPATSAASNLSQVLWLLGYPERALQCSESNLDMLRSLVKHPYSMAFGLDLAAVVRQYRGDSAATRTIVSEAIALSEQQGLAFIAAMAAILMGWATSHDGQLEDGIAQMRAGLASQLATGAELAKPYWLCLIANACIQAGQLSAAVACLDDAEASIERTDERYWHAEIFRLRGRYLQAGAALDVDAAATLARGPQPAEAAYVQAIQIASQQGARSLELRAVTDLARLWYTSGRAADARQLLGPRLNWFTEGRDTPDHQQAATLLAELEQELNPKTESILSGGR